MSVAEDAISAFALRMHPMLRSLTVRVDKDKIFVDGFGRILFLDLPFSVIAGLGIVGGRRLILLFPHVFLGDRAAGPDVVQAVVQTLTPLIDLDKDLGLHGALDLVGMRLRDGVLEAWGTATVPVVAGSP